MAKQTTFIKDLVKDPIPLTGTEAYVSDIIDLDRISDQFCAQITAKNAVAAEFKMVAELSVDGKDFVPALSEEVTVVSGSTIAPITSPEGHTSLFDFANGSGAGFLRLKLEMVAGSLEVTRVMIRAKEAR